MYKKLALSLTLSFISILAVARPVDEIHRVKSGRVFEVESRQGPVQVWCAERSRPVDGIYELALAWDDSTIITGKYGTITVICERESDYCDGSQNIVAARNSRSKNGKVKILKSICVCEKSNDEGVDAFDLNLINFYDDKTQESTMLERFTTRFKMSEIDGNWGSYSRKKRCGKALRENPICRI